jgi:phosphoglycolate phosphatase
MTIQAVLFDFDGTIADTLEVIVKITNRFANEFGYPPTTSEQLVYLKNISSRQILQNSQISIFLLPLLLRRVRQEMKQEIPNIQPIPGMPSMLKQLQQHPNLQLGIVTSNQEDNVQLFLETHQLDRVFSFLKSGRTIFGKHKLLKKAIEQENLSPQQVLYVGDETRDIEASRKTSIASVAVTWGFNSQQILQEYHPDFLISHPQQLLEIVQNW